MRRPLIVVAAGALFLSACGDGDDGGDGTPDPACGHGG
jgi:hypothetical protein